MYVYIHAPHKSDIGFSALQLHVVHISISPCKVDLCVQKPTPGRAVCSSGATMNPNANQGFLSWAAEDGSSEGGISHRAGAFSGAKPRRYCHVMMDHWPVNCISFIEARLNIYTVCIFQHKQRSFSSFHSSSRSVFKPSVFRNQTGSDQEGNQERAEI